MNRLLLISIVLTIGVIQTNHLCAQGLVDNGFMVGINYATFGGEDAKYGPGNKERALRYMFGVYLAFRLNDNVTLQPEINYSMKGVRYNGSDDGRVRVNGKNLNYLEIPILLILRTNVKTMVQVGPYVGIYLDGEEYSEFSSLDGTSSNSRAITPGGIHRLDYGLLFGLSYPLTDKLQVEARYSVGLRTVDNIYDDTLMNNVIQMTVHYSHM